MQTETFAIVYITGLVALFFLRVSYRLIAPEEIGGDGYGQLLQIREIREAGHKRPDSPGYSALKGRYAYPYLVHWLLSFVPDKKIITVERYFSGIMDVFFASIFLVMVYMDILTYQGALLALVIFVATPQFMRPDLAHGTGMSCRKPGLLLTVASIFAFLQWIGSGQIFHLLMAIIAGAAMMMTSRFSLQAYLFVMLPVAVFVHTSALIVVLGSIALAVVLTRGRYLRILHVHLRHVFNYAINKQYKMFDHSVPNPWIFLRNLIDETSSVERLRMLKNNKKLRIFIDNPYIFLVLSALFFGYGLLPLHTGYYLWISTMVTAAFVTSLPHLLFLGQPSRYLEYGLPPSAALIASAWGQLGWGYQILVVAMIVGGITVEIFYIATFQRFFGKPERREGLNKLADYFKSKETGVILAQPTYISRGLAWDTSHKIVETVGLVGTSSKEGIQQLNHLYPVRNGFVTDDLVWLKSNFDPDWVVFDIEKLEEMGVEDEELAPTANDPIFQNDNFEVYEFRDLS